MFFPALLLKLKTFAAASLVLVSALFGSHNPTFGSAIYAVADFRSSLSAPISAVATSMTLVSTTTASGEALTQGRIYGFKIGGREYVLGTLSAGKQITSLTRGVSLINGTTTGGIAEAWGRGAAVEITDAPILLDLANKANGISNFDNVMVYAPGTTFATSSDQIPSARFISGFAGVASSSAYNTLINSNNTWLGTNTYSAAVTANAAANFTAAATGLYATASSSFVTNGRLNDIAISGSPDASLTSKGIVEIATQTENASSTATGNTTAPLVITSTSATSTFNAATAALRVVVTQNNGKIDPYFIATTSLGIAASNIQVYIATSAPATWTKPSTALVVEVTLIGAGGGGSGGYSGNGDNGGGGGGGGGGKYTCILPASALGSTETVTVGTGGPGGAASSPGVAGTASTFGAWCKAGGGAGGTSAVNTIGVGGIGGTGAAAGSAVNTAAVGGGGGGGSTNVSVGGVPGGDGYQAGAGGGGGGGNAFTHTSGGAGGSQFGLPSTITGGAPGASPANVAANNPAPGAGGGGGGASVAGGRGGYYGGGGGGGGAGPSGSGMAAGGSGMDGIVIVTSW